MRTDGRRNRIAARARLDAIETELDEVRAAREQHEVEAKRLRQRESELARVLTKVLRTLDEVVSEAPPRSSRQPVRELTGNNKKIVDFLEKSGPSRPSEIADATGVPITHVNVYLGRLSRWIVKIDRGLYDHVRRAGGD